MFFSSTLLALVLSSPEAEAKSDTKRARHIGLLPFVTDTVKRVAVIVPAGEATALTAEITSDSGTESVALTESNAWLHGSASLKALPVSTAKLSLAVYDESSASLLTFSGTLGTDGTVSLAADAGKGPDIEVLAAEVFPNSAGGYDLAFDFIGADAHDVAQAALRIDDKSGSTKAEVDFDEIGAVWEGDLRLDPEGEIEVNATSQDADGKKLEKSTARFGHILHMQQDSFSAGHAMLSIGDAGSASLISDELHNGGTVGFLVVSDGWTSTTAPASAQVELDGGETLSIPANSYQRAGMTTVDIRASSVVSLNVAIPGGTLTLDGTSTLTLADLSSPVCANGTCVSLSENAKGTLDVSVTGYATTAGKVAEGAAFSLVAYDKSGAKVGSTSTKVAYDAAVAAVFAQEVGFAADPVGIDLSGEVSLLGDNDKKGNQKAIANGDFHGSFVRTEGGSLALGGVDKNDAAPKGDILIGGEPIDFELTDTNKDGVIEAPPVVFLRVDSNGKGTRAAATASSGNPGLL